MAEENTRIVLASRPEGWVSEDNFRLESVPLQDPKDGEVRVRTVTMSLDPYMRARMNDVKSYIPPFQLGEVLQATAVGVVEASRADHLKEGDWVTGMWGWETHSVWPATELRKIDPNIAPPSYHLGILGLTGMTAYVGLKGVANLQDGENVFVSAASGAVGSAVGQIAKNMGCHVGGCAGSDEKVAFCTDELGFDGCFNYKTVPSLPKAVRDVCPKGVDVNFENVGGEIMEAVIWNMRDHGRIALCGMISSYNDSEPRPGPANLFVLIQRSVRLEGFIFTNYPDLCAEWVPVAAGWLKDGKLKTMESYADGLENAPAAFIGLLKGENFGKQLVRVSDA